MHYIYAFEKLDAWKLSRKVASLTYQVTKTFPSEEKYGLVQPKIGVMSGN